MTKKHKPKRKASRKAEPKMKRKEEARANEQPGAGRPKSTAKLTHRRENDMKKALATNTSSRSAVIPSMQNEARFTGRKRLGWTGAPYRKMPPIEFVKGGLLFGLELKADRVLQQQQPLEGDFIKEFEDALNAMPLDEEDSIFQGDAYQEIVHEVKREVNHDAKPGVKDEIKPQRKHVPENGLAQQVESAVVVEAAVVEAAVIEDPSVEPPLVESSLVEEVDVREVEEPEEPEELKASRNELVATAESVHASPEESIAQSDRDASQDEQMAEPSEASEASDKSSKYASHKFDTNEFGELPEGNIEAQVQKAFEPTSTLVYRDDDETDPENVAVYSDAGTEDETSGDDDYEDEAATYARLKNLTLYELGGLEADFSLVSSDDDDFDFAAPNRAQNSFSALSMSSSESDSDDDDILREPAADIDSEIDSEIDLPIHRILGTRIGTDDIHLLVEWAPDSELYNPNGNHQYYPRSEIYEMFKPFNYTVAQIDRFLKLKGALVEDSDDNDDPLLDSSLDIDPAKLENDFSVLDFVVDTEGDSSIERQLENDDDDDDDDDDTYNRMLQAALNDIQNEVRDARVKTRASKKAKRRERELLHTENRLTKRGRKRIVSGESALMDLYSVFPSKMTSDEVVDQIELFLCLPEKQVLHFPPFGPKSNVVVREFCSAYNLNATVQGSRDSFYSVLASKTKKTMLGVLDRDEDLVKLLMKRRKKHFRIDVSPQKAQRSLKTRYNLEDILYNSNLPETKHIGLPYYAPVEVVKSSRKATAGHAQAGVRRLKEGDLVGAHASEIGSDNIGHRLLSKMGWNKGSSLGAREAGIKEPIHAVVKTTKVGLGANA